MFSTRLIVPNFHFIFSWLSIVQHILNYTEYAIVVLKLPAKIKNIGLRRESMSERAIYYSNLFWAYVINSETREGMWCHCWFTVNTIWKHLLKHFFPLLSIYSYCLKKKKRKRIKQNGRKIKEIGQQKSENRSTHTVNVVILFFFRAVNV